MVGRGAVVREHGQARDDPQADGVGAAAGIDHRVAHHGRARARGGEHRALLVGAYERVVQGARLEDRSEVERRTVAASDSSR